MDALFPQKSAACGYGQFDPQFDAPAVEKHIDQRESGGRLSRTQAVQDQGKFVAADAKQLMVIILIKNFLQSAGDVLEGDISGVMAIFIIDGLKAVGIQNHTADIGAGVSVCEEIQALFISGPVGKSGQRIRMSEPVLLLEPLFQSLDADLLAPAAKNKHQTQSQESGGKDKKSRKFHARIPST